MIRAFSLATVLVSLTLAALLAPPALGQASGLQILGLEVAGEPQWIHGDPVGGPEVRFTVHNAGSTPIAGYTIEYHWVQGGQKTWLRGTHAASVDAGGPLEALASRPHQQPWTLQIGQEGWGAVLVLITPDTQSVAQPNVEATVTRFVPVHDLDLVLPGDDQTIRPLETRFARAHVTNHGNVPETIDLNHTAHVEPARRLGDLEDYLQYSTLVVPPGATRVSTLFVDYHFNGESGAFTANHTLTVQTGYGRTLEATTPDLSGGVGNLPDPSPFRLEGVGDLPTVPEGGTATADYRITNTGNAADTYRLTAVPATGWQAEPFLPGATPPSGGGIRAALDPGQFLQFSVEIQAPADAAPGTPADVVLRVVSDRRLAQPVDEAWRFRVQGPAVRVEPAGDWDDALYTGDAARVAVHVHNDGDASSPVGTLRLRVLPAPGAEPVLVATAGAPVVLPGQSATVALDAGTYSEPGPAHFLIDWIGAGVHAQSLDRERFLRDAAVGLTLPAPLAGAPGELVGYRAGNHVLVVRNDGNAEETFRAHVTSGDVLLAADPVFTLAPGQQRSLSFDHRVPRPAGLQPHVDAAITVALADRPDRNWTARVSTQVLDVNPPLLQTVDVPSLWTLGEPLVLTVSAADDSAVQSVRVHQTDPSGTVMVHEMARSTAENWTRSLALAAGNHSLSFSARDAHGNEANVSATAVEVRPVPPPSVQVVGARDGSQVRPDVLLEVLVEDELPIQSVTVQVRNGTSVLWQRNLDPGERPIRFDLAGTPAGAVTVMVEATNAAGSRSNQTLALTVVDAADPPADLDVSSNDAPAPALWSLLAAVLAGAGLRRGARPPKNRMQRVSKRRRATRHASALLVVALMLGVPLAPANSTGSTVDSTTLEWWGSTEVGDGFHVRFPVTVQNHRDHPVANGVVLAEVDVAQKLVEAGWVSQARSSADLLRSFELDDASVRVVAMTNLKPMNPSNTDGRLGLHTTEYPAPDLRRNEVPSTHFAGSLSGREGATFEARTNPYLTVLWRVPDTLAPGEERHYVVYLDSRTNRDTPHIPPDYRDTPGGAALERTFWSGPGVDLVGMVAPAGGAGTATVVGLHDDTQVTIYTGDADSGVFQKQAGGQGKPDNPFTIGRHESRLISISLSEPTPFRLVASKPVLALVDSEGYVPSTVGDTVGKEFLFYTTYQAASGQDSLYFHNHHPSQGETVVRLDRLSATGAVQGTQTIHLSNGINFLPYTVGARGSQGDGCLFDTTPDMAPIQPGRASYRAEVTQGGPVSLQLHPVSGLTQVPAADGAPWGTTFWSVLNRVSTTGSTCGDLRQFAVYATSWQSPTELALRSPECEKDPCSGGFPVGPLPDNMLLGRTFRTDGLPERPVRLDTGTPISLMIAPPPLTASLANAPLRGPLGGDDAGREFVGYGSQGGPPLLYAPFGGTTVEARIQYASSGTQMVVHTLRLVGGQITALPQQPGDPILSYRLEADRPIVALPRGAPTGFLAGVPATLDATVHAADYRGHLVEIKSATGLDPVSGSTVPGKPIAYEFTVTNRGRGAGAAPLADTIDLDTAGVPPGWSVGLSRTGIPLAGGASTSVRLTVTPAQDAEPGQIGSISVVATSRGNPQAFHAADSVTHIKSTFDVGIWFNVARVGPKGSEGSGAAGEPVNYTVVVQNLGSVADTVALDVTPPDPGWEAVLLQGGVPATHLSLAPGGTAELVLRVVSPSEATQGLLLTSVTARSTSSPAVVDRVFARTSIHAPSDLSLEVDAPMQWLEPGREAVFNATLRNEGGATQVFFDLRADMLPGWTEPTVFLRQPHTGVRLHAERVSIEPGQVVHFGVAINASSEATTGDRVSTRLQLTAAGQPGSLGEFLHAIVRPVHRIEAETPPLPLHVPRGGVSVPVELRLTNNGSMDERLAPSVTSLPPGWSLDFPAQEVLLPRNATQVLRLELEVPAGAAEGAYAVAVVVASLDGARTEVEIPVHVGTFASHALNGTESLTTQPGRTAWAEHTVRNDGNTPLEVHVEALDGEAWPVVGADAPVPLPPGAETVLRIGWRVPADAPDGQSRHRAEVVLRPASPDVETIRDTVEVDLDVGRPALRLVSTDGFAGAAGRVVHAQVANGGVRTAFDVVVELRVASESVDRVVLAQVPPGSTRNVTLLQPQGQPGVATVVVDPDHAVVESDRNDNVLTVPDAQAHAAPGTTWPLLAVLLAFLAGARSSMASRQGRGMGSEAANGHRTAGNDLCTEGSRPTNPCLGGRVSKEPCGGMRP